VFSTLIIIPNEGTPYFPLPCTIIDQLESKVALDEVVMILSYFH